MKPNLSIIAKESGYSVPTVSRVLSGKAKGWSKSVDIILKAAKKMGYNYIIPIYPNSIVLPKVVLITEHYAEEFYSCLYESCDRLASEKNLDFNFLSIRYNQDIASAVKHASYTANGIILMIPSLNVDSYKAIRSSLPDFPIVNMAASEDILFPTVTHDSYHGGSLAAQCLMESGFTSFGIINGPIIKLEANLRRSGFVDKLRKNGQKACFDFVQNGIEKIGIFSANDQMALGFIHSALEKGYKIPGDIGVVGYDNMPYGKIYYPRLTTVNTDLDQLCNTAFDIIISLFNKPNERHDTIKTVLPVQLKKRATHLYET
jgi:DNA-binding LacI/PurR family transcriptional regulator